MYLNALVELEGGERKYSGDISDSSLKAVETKAWH